MVLYSLSRPETAKPMRLKLYKENLLQSLETYAASLYNPDIDIAPSKAGRPSTIVCPAERVSDKRHIIVYDDNDRNCVVCSTSKARKRTKFRCSGCVGNPYLHPKDCFLKFHSK